MATEKKSLVNEFKDFLLRGNLVELAVAVVIGTAFAVVVSALVRDIITPIIAAIFGKPDYRSIGFDIGDARISIGLVIDAVITFIVVGFLLFLILKGYDRMRRSKEQPEADTELTVLREIRDELQRGREAS